VIFDFAGTFVLLNQQNHDNIINRAHLAYHHQIYCSCGCGYAPGRPFGKIITATYVFFGLLSEKTVIRQKKQRSVKKIIDNSIFCSIFTPWQNNP